MTYRVAIVLSSARGGIVPYTPDIQMFYDQLFARVFRAEAIRLLLMVIST